MFVLPWQESICFKGCQVRACFSIVIGVYLRTEVASLTVTAIKYEWINGITYPPCLVPVETRTRAPNENEIQSEQSTQSLPRGTAAGPTANRTRAESINWIPAQTNDIKPEWKWMKRLKMTKENTWTDYIEPLTTHINSLRSHGSHTKVTELPEKIQKFQVSHPNLAHPSQSQAASAPVQATPWTAPCELQQGFCLTWRKHGHLAL